MESTSASASRGEPSGVLETLAKALEECRQIGGLLRGGSSREGVGAEHIKIKRGQCIRLILRVQQLQPVLERLSSDTDAVAADPRSAFVIFRLDSELQEASSLLRDCSRASALAAFLSLGRRGLTDRLNVCLAEIRQCYTECLILLGREIITPSAFAAQGIRPGSSHARPELSLPSSPMVDRSPRAMGTHMVYQTNYRNYFGSVGEEPPNRVGRSASMSLREMGAGPGQPGGIPRQHSMDAMPLPPLAEGGQAAAAALGLAQASAGEGAEPLPPQQQHADEVRELVTQLGAGSSAEKQTALAALIKICEESDQGKLEVAAAGAIPILSVLLAIDHDQTKMAAASVLLHLSWLDENRIVIAKAGCVPFLVQLLQSGNPQSRTLAARVLWNLAINVDNKVIIASAEAIPSLVAIIQSDSELMAKQEAAEALVQLTSNNPSNQKAVAEAGAIPSLVSMLREGGPKEQEKAAFALGMLAVNNDENKLTIAGSGAAPLLLDLLLSPYPSTAKSAAWTLYVLSSHSISATYILASGGLRTVHAALETAPAEAQYWARYTLSLLEPGSGPPDKAHVHRFNGMPTRRDEVSSPHGALLRRQTREKVFSEQSLPRTRSDQGTE